MGRRVRKTLNIDVEKLRRVKDYLGAATETEAIDRLLEDCDFERELAELIERASPSWKQFRTPLSRTRTRR